MAGHRLRHAHADPRAGHRGAGRAPCAAGRCRAAAAPVPQDAGAAGLPGAHRSIAHEGAPDRAALGCSGGSESGTPLEPLQAACGARRAGATGARGGARARGARARHLPARCGGPRCEGARGDGGERAAVLARPVSRRPARGAGAARSRVVRVVARATARRGARQPCGPVPRVDPSHGPDGSVSCAARRAALARAGRGRPRGARLDPAALRPFPHIGAKLGPRARPDARGDCGCGPGGPKHGA